MHASSIMSCYHRHHHHHIVDSVILARKLSVRRLTCTAFEPERLLANVSFLCPRTLPFVPNVISMYVLYEKLKHSSENGRNPKLKSPLMVLQVLSTACPLARGLLYCTVLPHAQAHPHLEPYVPLRFPLCLPSTPFRAQVMSMSRVPAHGRSAGPHGRGPDPMEMRSLSPVIFPS
jgi:hypothetical protein